MDRKIDNTMQITGKSWLPEGLEMEREYKVELTGTVNKVSMINNEDGSFERKFNVQQEKATIIGSKKLIKAKDRLRRSQAMRRAFYFIWENETEYQHLSFEEFYEYAMAILNSNLSDIWEIAKEKFIINK